MALLTLLGTMPACQGDRGAVSFRWRILDKTTGLLSDPRDHGGEGGACLKRTNQTILRNCEPFGDGWWIKHVRLDVADPVSGQKTFIESRFVEFTCRTREATTEFEIPLGTWALSVRAVNPPDPPCAKVGTTPPPQVRDVKKGEIVNLDVIEIAVNPLPRSEPTDMTPPPDAGSPP